MAPKNRDAKRKAAHVYSSGGGGGTKGPSVVDKRDQELQCPHCERIFKQSGRLKEHIASKHAGEAGPGAEQSAADAAASAPAAAESRGPDGAAPPVPAAPGAAGDAGTTNSLAPKLMDVNSRAGYYERKSPKLLLHELCLKLKRPKPRYVMQTTAEGLPKCKLLLPGPRPTDAPLVLFWDAPDRQTDEELCQHHVAVVGLHRLAGERQMDLLLPPHFAQQWRDLCAQATVRQASKARAHAFAVQQQQRQRATEAASKRRQPQTVIMTAEKRDLIASVLQAVQQHDLARIGHTLELKEGGQQLAEELQELGFHAEHARAAAAVEGVDTLSQALEWLCLSVPEEDLPERFAPGSGGKPVTVLQVRGANGSYASLPEAVASSTSGLAGTAEGPGLQQLMGWGYPRGPAVQALQAAEGDLLRALQALYGTLTGGEAATISEPAAAAANEAWQEEREALAAIYDNQITMPDAISMRISVASLAQESHDAAQEQPGVDLTVFVTKGYPAQAAPILALCNTSLATKVDAAERPAGVLAHNTIPTGSCETPWAAVQLRALTAALAATAQEAVGEAQGFAAVERLQEALLQLQDGAQEASRKLPWKVLLGPDASDPFLRLPTAIPSTTELPSQSGSGRTDAVSEKPEDRETADWECSDAAPDSLAHVASTTPCPTRDNGMQCSAGDRRKAGVLDEEAAAQESSQLLQEARRFDGSAEGKKWKALRGQLPAYKQRTEILTAIASHPVTVVCGATGCGKSTQVPQFLLEEAISKGKGGEINIVVTQPRRISATGVSSRVAQERCESLGSVVGYSVRMDSKTSSRTRLLFCTTGVLLRRLMSCPTLAGLTHVVVDEVHERSLDSDLLLLLLRKALSVRPSLKIVLMSATADADLFTQYFMPVLMGKGAGRPAAISIPGRTFPVTDLYLEDAYSVLSDRLKAMGRGPPRQPPKGKKLDQEVLTSYGEPVALSLAAHDSTAIPYDFIVELIAYIMATEAAQGPGALYGQQASEGPSSGPLGSILVFLPGAEEISRLVRQLTGNPKLLSACPAGVIALPLHGGLPPAQQAKVFSKPNAGARKVVVSTNVAETSITIEDCTVVIDCCRVKEIGYDASRGITRLQTAAVSQAAAQQRRGRAGRVRPGVCFRLLSRKAFAALDLHTSPEICRVPLGGLCLQIKAATVMSALLVQAVLGAYADVAAELQQALTPPSAEAIATALQNLQVVGALELQPDNPQARPGVPVLTGLGRHLAALPMDLHIAKMLVYACMLRCVSPVLTIAGAMAYGRPMWVSPQDKRVEAEAAKKTLLAPVSESKSDHIALVAAYNGWRLAIMRGGRKAGNTYCQEYFLVESVLEGISANRRDFASKLIAQGLLPETYSEGAVESEALRVIQGRLSTGVKASYAVDVALYSHDMDSYSHTARVVKAAVAAGLYPNLLRVEAPPPKFTKVEGGAVELPADPSKMKFFDRVRGRVFLHPASTNFHCGKYESGWLVYSEVLETAKVYVRECSMVPIYSILLFGGSLTVQHEEGTVKVDDWATFKAPARIAVLLQHLRSQLNSLLLRKFEATTMQQHEAVDAQAAATIEAVRQLLAMDGF